jgi:hypothetical protein
MPFNIDKLETPSMALTTVGRKNEFAPLLSFWKNH